MSIIIRKYLCAFAGDDGLEDLSEVCRLPEELLLEFDVSGLPGYPVFHFEKGLGMVVWIKARTYFAWL